MNVDWTAIIAATITGLLSIGAISIFLKNNMPEIAKWVALAKDAIETLSDISQALAPDVNGKVDLTPEEIAKINLDVAQFKVDLAKALGK